MATLAVAILAQQRLPTLARRVVIRSLRSLARRFARRLPSVAQSGPEAVHDRMTLGGDAQPVERGGEAAGLGHSDELVIW